MTSVRMTHIWNVQIFHVEQLIALICKTSIELSFVFLILQYLPHQVLGLEKLPLPPLPPPPTFEFITMTTLNKH